MFYIMNEINQVRAARGMVISPNNKLTIPHGRNGTSIGVFFINELQNSTTYSVANPPRVKLRIRMMNITNNVFNLLSFFYNRK